MIFPCFHEQQSMDVIRHDNELIKSDRRESLGQSAPHTSDHATSFIQLHISVNDPAKQRESTLSDNSDEVSAAPSIVILGETQRSPSPMIGHRTPGGVYADSLRRVFASQAVQEVHHQLWR